MIAFYLCYTTTFLTVLADYAHVTAVLMPQTEGAYYITISQFLDVDGSPLIVALAVSVDAFHALASGYSGVSLDSREELAVDTVSELFNVINGHFSSHMREIGCAVSIIAPPRHCYGVVNPPTLEFSCGVGSPVGDMRLMATHEEFLAAQATA